MAVKFPKGISKCRAPKMTNVRGRTWDRCPLVLPDGSETVAYLDTTFGTYFYFQQPDGWHSGKLDTFKWSDEPLRIDLRARTVEPDADDVAEVRV